MSRVSRWGEAPVQCRHSSAPGVIVTIAIVVAFGWAYNQEHPAKPKTVAHPAPAPPPRTIVKTVTRTVYEHASSMSGIETVLIVAVICAAVVAVVAIIGRRWGR